MAALLQLGSPSWMSELQHFTYPHATPGRQFKHKTVSWLYRSEDDFIHDCLVQDCPVDGPAPSEQFFNHEYTARILQFGINGVLNQVEKGSQTGITGSSGGVFLPFGDLVQE